MGSAALADAVPYPGKAARISRKGQRNTKRKEIRKFFVFFLGWGGPFVVFVFVLF